MFRIGRGAKNERNGKCKDVANAATERSPKCHYNNYYDSMINIQRYRSVNFIPYARLSNTRFATKILSF